MAKEKVQKDKQRSTKHTYKTKDRVTRTPLKTGVNSCAPECATNDTSRVNLVTNEISSLLSDKHCRKQRSTET
jgi:hypothetical protein